MSTAGRPMSPENAARLARFEKTEVGGTFVIENATQASLSAFRSLLRARGYKFSFSAEGENIHVTRRA